jgi:hypothetical protein
MFLPQAVNIAQNQEPLSFLHQAGRFFLHNILVAQVKQEDKYNIHVACV